MFSPANTRVSQLKTLHMIYLVIHWTQKVRNDFVFLCSIVLPPVGQSSNHQYHCRNLQGNRVVVRIFIAFLRFSINSPSYLEYRKTKKRNWKRPQCCILVYRYFEVCILDRFLQNFVCILCQHTKHKRRNT